MAETGISTTLGKLFQVDFEPDDCPSNMFEITLRVQRHTRWSHGLYAITGPVRVAEAEQIKFSVSEQPPEAES